MESCISGQRPHHTLLTGLQRSAEGCLTAPGPDAGGGEYGDKVPLYVGLPLGGNALGMYVIHQAWCVDHLYNTVTYDLGPTRERCHRA